MKKIFTALFAFVATLTASAQAWDGTAAIWTNGDGTEANPYLIETPANLAYLSTSVNATETYEGKFFKVANELNMGADAGQIFRPIGKFDNAFNTTTMQQEDNSFYFKGTFDGNNKPIRNLMIQLEEEGELGGTGLFAAINAPAHIHNVILSNSVQVAGTLETGSLVGHMTGGLVENILFQGRLNGTMNCGGIVAVADDGIIQCCFNTGEIQGTADVGGIIAQPVGNTVVKNCINAGPVTSSPSYGAGGIASSLFDQSSVINCYNTGKVTAPVLAGIFEPHAVVGDKSSSNGKVENNYYVEATSGLSDPSATAKTADEMKTQEVLDALNAGQNPTPFVKDEKGINSGFPVLAWLVKAASDGIEETVNIPTDGKFVINGREITASQKVSIFTVGGSLIGQGTHIALPAEGLYIVKSATTVAKILVK